MFLRLGQSNEGRNKEVEVWKERPCEKARVYCPKKSAWCVNVRSPPSIFFLFFFFFFLSFPQASLLICAQKIKLKAKIMDMFPLTNTGVKPPHCQTLYLLFNNDLATTIWTFHRLLLADIDMFLGRESVFNVIIIVEITHSATPILVSSIIQPFPRHAKTRLKN